MATTLLTLGGVEFNNPPDPVEQIVGDPPQWSDDSDATYAYVADVVTTGFPSSAGARAPVTVPVSGDLVSLRFFVRAKADPGYGPTPTRLTLILHDFADGYADTDFILLPHDGAIHETWVDGVVYTANNPPGWLASPNLTVESDSGSTFSRVWIYEVAVEVTTDAETVRLPATRQYPRDDNRGLGSPRLYPHPKSGRVVGGYL